MINKKGVCCIVLELEEQDPPLKFKTMTYKRFSSLPREEALEKLGNVIVNNLKVTEAAIRYCGERGFAYRMSSDVFPLMTYDKAELMFHDFPQFPDIEKGLEKIKEAREAYDIRLSMHPDQFNVLASDNKEAVSRTIKELDFYGWFMTKIGCPMSHEAPINIHVNRSVKTSDECKFVRDLFIDNFDRLDDNVKTRLVLENDDKTAGWTVKQLYDHFKFPITFDYLHHKCHPGEGHTREEKYAISIASYTWTTTPLFHYSESIPGNKNPRKHADYATQLPETYGYSFDLDFEFKMKEKSFQNL